MIDESKLNKKPHTLELKNRKTLILSGVCDVESFDDELIVLNTELGTLHIQGKNLHISKLNLASGEVNIDGLIVALVYTGDSKPKKNLIAKIFK